MTHTLKVITLWIASALTSVTVFTTTSSSLQPPRVAVTVAKSWEITFNEVDDHGHLTAAAVCNNHAYISDVKSNEIMDIDLSTGRQAATLPWTSALGSPLVLLSDCARDTVYVAGERGACAFSLTDRTVKKTYAFPSGFVAAKGSLTLDPSRSALFVSGIWTNPSEWNNRDLSAILDGSRLGLRISLMNGTSEPLVRGPIERGCAIFISACMESVLALGSENDPYYFLSHKMSHRVGIFNKDGVLTRTFNIASPLFKAADAPVGRNVTPASAVKWLEEHSLIHGLYNMGTLLVVVHATQKPSTDWKPGDWTNAQVYLNLYATDGTLLGSDLSIPDLPAGSDENGIYVFDFGQQGRRDRPTSVFLRRIAVITSRL